MLGHVSVGSSTLLRWANASTMVYLTVMRYARFQSIKDPRGFVSGTFLIALGLSALTKGALKWDLTSY